MVSALVLSEASTAVRTRAGRNFEQIFTAGFQGLAPAKLLSQQERVSGNPFNWAKDAYPSHGPAITGRLESGVRQSERSVFHWL
jgi:hypothetical protein